MSKKYPTDEQAKRAIVEFGKRMYARGYVVTNDGNVTVKVGENTIWCTPTGVSKGYMNEDMMVKMDLDGTVLEGTRKPSSEIKMHLRVYRENPEVMSVVHAHPIAATTFAIAGIPLDSPILVEAMLQIGLVPVAKTITRCCFPTTGPSPGAPPWSRHSTGWRCWRTTPRST